MEKAFNYTMLCTFTSNMRENKTIIPEAATFYLMVISDEINMHCPEATILPEL